MTRAPPRFPVLAAHREEQEQDKINFGSAYQDNGLVFAGDGRCW
jgi:hypothetical protein